ncbi:MAG: serine/threonine protein kinase [Chloroflexota bacterium]|jgi:diguanylate cyclase (GGDEF)-like protein
MSTNNIASHDLLAMLTITRRLAEQHMVQPLIAYVAATVFELVSAERCSVVLFGDDDGLDVRIARDRRGNPLDEADQQFSRSILGQVRITAEPLLTNDALTDTLLNDAASIHSLSLRSVMCVPLVSHERVIGAIYAENRSVRAQFREEHLLPLVLFSHQVVTALENARLYESLEARIAERTMALQEANALLERQASELREQSIRDSLTGLHNRRYINELLPQLFAAARRHGRPLALACLDIDHFKHVNDTFFHTIGDQVLAGIARILREHLRGADSVARIGGEEFAVLMPETSLHDALQVCERLRVGVAQSDWGSLAPGLQVTISIGLATDAGCADSQELMHHADTLLYAAKHTGRNRVMAGEQAPQGEPHAGEPKPDTAARAGDATQPYATNAGRYQIHELLGIGSMGSVYRATDRLSGQPVALKQVRVAPADLAFTSRPPDDTPQALLLALAHEFRTLAGLRHPYIISVLDYGFDDQRQPFFTMELLPGAQTLLEAAGDQPRAGRIALLAQAAEALAYLHQRGVVHRDLKPANILVAGGSVRVLDFGLAVATSHERTQGVVGTLRYLAPEVLDGRSYTPAADLYSLGALAYELIIGRHPFPADTVDEFLDLVSRAAPDLAPLADQPDLAALLGTLLSKDPEDRPPSAAAVAAALRRVLGQADAYDTAAIRESYLQAAAFVGREDELGRLREALHRTTAGHRELWLIGGESGVGKSRLLDELRIEALVTGAIVATGQAVEGAGLPYQLWRGVLPRLLLERQPDDLTAGVLKAIVPDIERLLGRHVPDAPELPGEAGDERRALAIIELFRLQPWPVVVILEDLQWAAESLGPLQRLCRAAHDLPLLILASYRDDDHPDLPRALPEMKLLPLKRMTQHEIAALGRSMLGSMADDEAVVRLLQRETEGNAFFLVEVARALASEVATLPAGSLTSIPTRIFAGGVQQAVRRRLGRVPAWAQPLLVRAAVAGRALDLAVVAHMAGRGVDIGGWLTTCADAAVLTVEGQRWQFAHDRLREALLADVSPAEHPLLHRDVALAIESAHAGDTAYAGTLADHWYHAGDVERMLEACRVVADHLLHEPTGYERSQHLLERALAHPQSLDAPQRPYLLAALGTVAERLSRHDEATRHYQACLDLVGDDLPGLRARALNGLSLACWYHTDYARGTDYARQALEISRAAGNQQGEAESLCALGLIASDQGEQAEAEEFYQQSLRISRAIGDLRQAATALNYLGSLALARPDHRQAEECYRESLSIAQAIGDQVRVSACLNNLGEVALDRGDYPQALSYYQACLSIDQALDDQFNIGVSHLNLGRLAARQEDHRQALEHYRESMRIVRALGARSFLPVTQPYQAFSLLAVGELDEARDVLRETVALAQELRLLRELLCALLAAARLRLQQGRPADSARIAGLIQTHPRTTHEIRSCYLKPLVADLKAALGPKQLASAMGHGALMTLKETVAEVLAELAPPTG